MLKDEPLVRNLSFLDKKAINWLRCGRWVRLIDTDKNLGTALVELQWIEDQVHLWLNKMTRHISEAEASQKIIARAQTLGIITVEEKQRGVFTCQQQKHNHTPFCILAKISQAASLQQVHRQLP